MNYPPGYFSEHRNYRERVYYSLNAVKSDASKTEWLTEAIDRDEIVKLAQQLTNVGYTVTVYEHGQYKKKGQERHIATFFCDPARPNRTVPLPENDW